MRAVLERALSLASARKGLAPEEAARLRAQVRRITVAVGCAGGDVRYIDIPTAIKAPHCEQIMERAHTLQLHGADEHGHALVELATDIAVAFAPVPGTQGRKIAVAVCPTDGVWPSHEVVREVVRNACVEHYGVVYEAQRRQAYVLVAAEIAQRARDTALDREMTRQGIRVRITAGSTKKQGLEVGHDL